jgi:hypothetical protein
MNECVAWIAAAAESRHTQGAITRIRPRLHGEAIAGSSELWIYRSRTVALLRRYMRFSLETGRLPSILGKELFRAAVTSYRAVTFEDRVIFVSDVDKILGQLPDWEQQLIARIILQEHTPEKAATLLHCCRKTIDRKIPEVLDWLSERFLEVGLLMEVPSRQDD